jgi:MtN3 and saliva related transmembrane protein
MPGSRSGIGWRCPLAGFAVMTLADWIGVVSGTLTSVAFLPQVLRVWRTRSAHDLSVGMYAVFVAGVCGWLLYGVLIHAWPVVAANAVTLLLASAVLVLKLYFERAGAR